MSITIGKYTFAGPFSSLDGIEDKSGVYAVLSATGEQKYNLVDIGESATVKTRLLTHDRKDCWKSNSQGNPTFAVYYTPALQQAGRMQVEQELRNIYHPACGIR